MGVLDGFAHRPAFPVRFDLTLPGEVTVTQVKAPITASPVGLRPPRGRDSQGRGLLLLLLL